jgi:Uma2 family endonuclease
MSIAPSPNDAETKTFGEPAWDVARLFPAQGSWSVREYFDLEARAGRLVEFDRGRIEVLTMPTMSHQEIMLFLYDALRAFVATGRLGKVMIAGIRVRLWEDKYREPDILFMSAEHAGRISEEEWDGADLVMEVVSQDRARDLEVKREEYARAGIPEYWIVDPRDRKITVLTLDGEIYAVHGEFAPGDRATSRLLPGFEVAVAGVFADKP